MKTWLVYKRGLVCEKCGKKVAREWDLIADHIVPIALGGNHLGDESNIQLLCLDCNKEKTKKDMGNIARQKRINKVREINRVLDEY